MPVDHYENFPVASWLLPARLRPPIEALYGFARGADDVADEGDAPAAERLAALDRYLQALDEIDRGELPTEARFHRIAQAVREYGLSTALLRDLIDAFKQDVVKKRYGTLVELLDYSRRSANPVGRLVLQVMAKTGDRPRFSARQRIEVCPRLSDLICSGLQLTNFWQDVAVDWEKGRVYIPQEDLARFGVGEEHIAAGRSDAAWAKLMRFECERTRAMLREGAPLGRALPGRMGLEIRATVAGGLAILDKIDAVSGDVFRHRPTLGSLDWMRILARSLA